MARPIDNDKPSLRKLFCFGLLGLCIGNAIAIGYLYLVCIRHSSGDEYFAARSGTTIGQFVLNLFPGHYLVAFMANMNVWGLIGGGIAMYWMRRGNLLKNEAGPTANQSEEQ